MKNLKVKSGNLVKTSIVNDDYPSRERAMHPYKIWLDETKQQRKNVKKTIIDI